MMDRIALPLKPVTPEQAHAARPIPPEAFFICSAIFHYLGPAFAVLLFARVDVLGVAWLRIASAAAVFAFWKRPWRLFAELRPAEKRIVIALGFVLAIMNVCFYLAINRLPLGTVGTIEFLGPIAMAALGVRTIRNLAALLLACGGVFLLTSVRISGEPIGYVFAFANCALFVLYILLGHRIAAAGGHRGVERLAMAMLVASVVVTPIGLKSALGTLLDPRLLLAGAGVGICSSVIPYICDQFAMARLSKATFALMLSLLPATACLVGIVVLRQIPSLSELAGVGAVIAGVALKRSADD
ncbi:MAG: EamA family transporter [Verrucomicrobia bacterium]|nr:MAG: EamA family transporter [Verrucomicrobiota bacterium]